MPVLVATDEEKKDQEIAKLKANLEEKEKEAKVAQDEKKDLEAKLAAADSFQEPGPEVHAKLIASMKKAMDEEKDHEAKGKMARAIKAMEEVFDTGNGVNTNATHDKDDLHAQEEKEEQTAVIASLTAKYIAPLIAKILKAKSLAGATAEDLQAEQKALSAMKLPEFEALYAKQEIFIEQALNAQEIKSTDALFAKIEGEFDFNGAALTGKTVDVDAAIQEASY